MKSWEFFLGEGEKKKKPKKKEKRNFFKNKNFFFDFCCCKRQPFRQTGGFGFLLEVFFSFSQPLLAWEMTIFLDFFNFGRLYVFKDVFSLNWGPGYCFSLFFSSHEPRLTSASSRKLRNPQKNLWMLQMWKLDFFMWQTISYPSTSPECGFYFSREALFGEPGKCNFREGTAKHISVFYDKFGG